MIKSLVTSAFQEGYLNDLIINNPTETIQIEHDKSIENFIKFCFSREIEPAIQCFQFDTTNGTYNFTSNQPPSANLSPSSASSQPDLLSFPENDSQSTPVYTDDGKQSSQSTGINLFNQDTFDTNGAMAKQPSNNQLKTQELSHPPLLYEYLLLSTKEDNMCLQPQIFELFTLGYSYSEILLMYNNIFPAPEDTLTNIMLSQSEASLLKRFILSEKMNMQ